MPLPFFQGYSRTSRILRMCSCTQPVNPAAPDPEDMQNPGWWHRRSPGGLDNYHPGSVESQVTVTPSVAGTNPLFPTVFKAPVAKQINHPGFAFSYGDYHRPARFSMLVEVDGSGAGSVLTVRAAGSSFFAQSFPPGHAGFYLSQPVEVGFSFTLRRFDAADGLVDVVSVAQSWTFPAGVFTSNMSEWATYSYPLLTDRTGAYPGGLRIEVESPETE